MGGGAGTPVGDRGGGAGLLVGARGGGRPDGQLLRQAPYFKLSVYRAEYLSYLQNFLQSARRAGFAAAFLSTYFST
jgi:hypothetical protein